MNHEVAVVGGGAVGATVACALGEAGVRTALIEARAAPAPRPAAAPGSSAPFAVRVSALTAASRRILEALGVWQRLPAARIAPFRAMRVWEAGRDLHFDAADIHAASLGHIVENPALQAALESRIGELSSVRWYRPAALDALGFDAGRVTLRLDTGRLRARLAVGADGARSRLRELAGIELAGGSYGQRAVVATVRCERGHEDTAWQRFLPHGPLALLPLPGAFCSMVWSTTPERAEALLAAPPHEFCDRVAEAFEHRLGALELAGERAAFDLGWSHARRYVAERVALAGDAAHTIHPLAGQGVNLGLLDAAALAETVIAALAAGRDPGRSHNLRPYERWRRGHNQLMQGALGGLHHLFTSAAAPVRMARGAGLHLTQALGPAKRLFMRHAAGLEGDLPALARSGLIPD